MADDGQKWTQEPWGAGTPNAATSLMVTISAADWRRAKSCVNALAGIDDVAEWMLLVQGLVHDTASGIDGLGMQHRAKKLLATFPETTDE